MPAAGAGGRGCRTLTWPAGQWRCCAQRPIAAAAAPATARGALLVVARTRLERSTRDSTRCRSCRATRPRASPELFALLRASQDPAQPALVRSLGAGIVERAALTPCAADGIDRVGWPPPDRWSCRACCAPSMPTATRRSACSLVAALERAASRASLRADVLKPRLAKYPRVGAGAGGRAAGARSISTPRRRRGGSTTSRAPSPAATSAADSCVFNSQKTGCVDLSRDRLHRRQGRAGSDAHRSGAHRARSAGGRRLSERELRAELRAGDGRVEVRRRPYRRAEERGSGARSC